MTLHDDEIRATLAAELRTVLDSYISPDMSGASAVAVLRAMEEASAYMLVRYGMAGQQSAGDVAKMLGAYVCGISNRIADLQPPAKRRQG